MHIMLKMCVLVMIALVTRTVTASESDQHAGVAVAAQHTGLSPIIPAWREHAANSNGIVPPPPGPYMSTALLSPMPGMYQPAYGNEQNAGTEMATSPFFMPDTQWPEDRRRPPHRWMPENGHYRYVSDELLEQQKELDAGYSRNIPRMQSRREYVRPVYHPQPVVERHPAYRGNSESGTN